MVVPLLSNKRVFTSRRGICHATAITVIGSASGKTKSKGSFFLVLFSGRQSRSLTVAAGWLPSPPGTLPLAQQQSCRYCVPGSLKGQQLPEGEGAEGIFWTAGQGPRWLGPTSTAPERGERGRPEMAARSNQEAVPRGGGRLKVNLGSKSAGQA